MYYINDNVIFVDGIYCGAIYDFNRNKIFSVNHEANLFLMRFIHKQYFKTAEEKEYIRILEDEGLIGKSYSFNEYIPQISKVNLLNFAWLEVTQACNLQCIHCYEGQLHSSVKDNLSLTEWKQIIKELSDIGCPNIQFIGGEPLCYSNICDLLDYAGQFNFNSIGIFTNATMLSDNIMACLLRNNIKVYVSIYGQNSQIHDRITDKEGSFDKTVNNIKCMLNFGIQITAAITLMQENEEYYEEIINFVKELGIKTKKIDLVRPVNGCSQSCHSVTRKDLLETKCRMYPKFSISKTKFDIACSRNTCWYGKFAISENGNVIPCVFERDIVYGNIHSMPIKELLESNKLTKYWHMSFDMIEECSVCEYRFACKDCRPLGVVNGGIKKKNIRCFYNPYTGKWNK